MATSLLQRKRRIGHQPAAAPASTRRSRRRFVRMAMIFAALAAGSVGAPAIGDDSANGARRDQEVRPSLPTDPPSAHAELLRLQGKIRLVMSEAQERRNAQTDRLKRLAFEKRSAQRAHDALAEEVRRKEKALEEKRSAITRAEGESRAASEENERMCGSVLDFLSVLETHIRSGPEWQREERLALVAEAGKLLNARDKAASEALTSIGRLQRKEELLAKAIEAAEVKLDGAQGTGNVLAFHVGSLAVFFADESGQIAGSAGAARPLAESKFQGPGAAANATGVSAALAILTGREAPRLVPLKFPEFAVAKVEERK